MPSANGKKLETILEDAATLTVVKTPEPEVAPHATPVIVPPAPTPETELTLEQKISKVEDLTMVIDR